MMANSIFFPSEIIHSKDISYNINTDASHDSNNNQQVSIFHKGDSSFYKSTRKIRRTAERLMSTVFCTSSSDDSCCAYCYWIEGGKQEVGIKKRLESEFIGECVRISFDLQDEEIDCSLQSLRDVHALRFGSENKTSKDTSLKGSLDIIFLDLDNLVHSISSDIELSIQIYWKIADNVTSSLYNQLEKSSNSNVVVHVKCEQLYRMLLDIDVTQNRAVIKSDIEAYLQQLSNEQEDSHSKVIRRLRQRKGAADCPLSIYPVRYVVRDNELVEICRFYNHDDERGCLRSKRARENTNARDCPMDHTHCHKCGEVGHRAIECDTYTHHDCASGAAAITSSLEPMVFVRNRDGGVQLESLSEYQPSSCESAHTPTTSLLPALVILGGRLRGRTLASCECLPLSTEAAATARNQWMHMSNLLEHRGSHAACSPPGTGLIFVMGGGGVDGNSDTVECLSVSNDGSTCARSLVEARWQILDGRLSSPRHAFGSVGCVDIDTDGTVKTAKIFAVGGWKHGSVSCESVDKLALEYPFNIATAQWEHCAKLLKARRLHSVVPSADGSSIYVFGGYIDERFTTPSIEMYDIASNKWTECDELPYGDKRNCPLVQAIPDWTSDNSFLIFPFGSERDKSSNRAEILRYTPGSAVPFSPVPVSIRDGETQHNESLRLPLNNWAAFSATSWKSQKKAYLVGGTINGKWTARSFELDLRTMKWIELSPMMCARRRSVVLVVE
jgi:hypothetical protein